MEAGPLVTSHSAVSVGARSKRHVYYIPFQNTMVASPEDKRDPERARIW